MTAPGNYAFKMVDQGIQPLQLIGIPAPVAVIRQLTNELGKNIPSESDPFFPPVPEVRLCRFIAHPQTGKIQDEPRLFSSARKSTSMNSDLPFMDIPSP